MKKLIHSVLPALTLLTLGGCAGTSALSTTESDGVYFSSKDRVSAPVAAQTTATQADATNSGEVANPDYTDNGASGTTSSTEYYDDGYSYASRLRRFHQPTYRGLGMGYYDFAYTDPFWYGGPAYAIMPYGGFGYGYGAGFYDPFYSPFWGGGTSISISFGRPFYRPFGYGYSYGYSPYDYYGYGYGGLGGGYYGGFGSGYYGGSLGSGYYDRGSSRSRVAYGPRRDGATEASRATGNATGSGPRGQVQQNGMLSPGTGNNTGVVTAPPVQRGRGRVQEVQPGTPVPSGSAGVLSSGNGNVTERVGQQNAGNQGQPNLNPSGGRRWRVLEQAGTQSGAQPTTTAPADYSQPRRGRGWGNEGQQAQQSGSTEQPTRRERAWQQPTRTAEQQTRSYEAPTRSYSEPSRSSSSPSNSGGNFGGGSSGGGGSRGRGRVN